MLSEEFFSSVCGPPIAPNTGISKDVGIYCQSLTPSYAVKSTFKKSATRPNCLAISDSHVFAAQNEKSQIHVYSRDRGTQEVTVTLGERIQSLALLGDVLAVGTTDGSLVLWEVSVKKKTPKKGLFAASLLFPARTTHFERDGRLTLHLDLHGTTGHHSTLPCAARLLPGCHGAPCPHRL